MRLPYYGEGRTSKNTLLRILEGLSEQCVSGDVWELCTEGLCNCLPCKFPYWNQERDAGIPYNDLTILGSSCCGVGARGSNQAQP